MFGKFVRDNFHTCALKPQLEATLGGGGIIDEPGHSGGPCGKHSRAFQSCVTQNHIDGSQWGPDFLMATLIS